MITQPDLLQAGLTTLILSWLGGCVVSDLRSRQVPVFWTVFPLAAAGLWRLGQGDWQSILLVAALVFASDLQRKGWRILAGCLALLAGLLAVSTFEQALLALVVFGVWFQWEIGATGGADAKISIALVLFFGDGPLIVPIAVAGGLQGLVGLFKKQRTIPYTVAILLGTAAYLLLRVRGQ